MAATASIPVYLTIGHGLPSEIGTIELTADPAGKITLSVLDIAAALRQTADAMEAAAREDSDAAPE